MAEYTPVIMVLLDLLFRIVLTEVKKKKDSTSLEVSTLHVHS